MTETDSMRADKTAEHLTIQIKDVSKSFGANRAVDSLTFNVRQGEVVGFLGPNGSGKTTTMRLALDSIRPTKGSIKLLGLDAHRHSRTVHRRVGYMPGELSLYDALSGRELLSYFGNLRGGVDWHFVQELADRLECDLSRPIRSLSTGNKHKVGLIQALMHHPELLILDEPTSGLDPLMQQAFHQLLTEIKSEGRTVFLSSHILPDAERVCDRVGIIRAGKLVIVERVEILKARALRHLEIHFASPVPKEAFSGLIGVQHLRVEDVVIHCTVTGTVDTVIKAASKYEVVNIISHEPSLEQVFFTYYNECEPNAE